MNFKDPTFERLISLKRALYKNELLRKLQSNLMH